MHFKADTYKNQLRHMDASALKQWIHISRCILHAYFVITLTKCTCTCMPAETTEGLESVFKIFRIAYYFDIVSTNEGK